MKKLVTALFLIFATAACTGYYEDGMAAFRKGDHTTAERLFKKGAEQADSKSLSALAQMYLFGKGVLQDYAEAARLFTLAAKQGDSGAQLKLASMYANGKGVLQDYAEAVRLNRLAAEQGDSHAQHKLASLYLFGEWKVLQDDAEAARLFTLAAKQGHAGAQYNLAVMFKSGVGVIQDDLQAHMWANLSAVFANKDIWKYRNNISLTEPERVKNERMVSEQFQKFRESLAARMTSQQIGKAQAMAKKCQSSQFKDCD